jgi:hypothetical protein
MVRYTEPRRKGWESIKGREELGQKVTTRKKLGRHALPPPGIQEVVAKRMKTGGLDAIHMWRHACNWQKGKEILGGVRNGVKRGRVRRG